MTDLAVIMSVYHKDRLRFVKESVQSILEQTFTNFHYYLVFDGPVDKGIEEYILSLEDDRIRLFRLEANQGLAAALNFLLEKILKNPEYLFIARMDADDVSMPERFEKQRDYLVSHPEITVLGSWYEEIDESGNHLCYKRLPTDHSSLKRRYYTRTPFAHSSVIYHRRLIQIAGYYSVDATLMEDMVLWGRALKWNLKFGNIPEWLHRLRIDNCFYDRRSGLKYGLRYIRIKSGLAKMSASFFTFILIFVVGIIKMFPAVFSKFFYTIIRKCKV